MHSAKHLTTPAALTVSIVSTAPTVLAVSTALAALTALTATIAPTARTALAALTVMTARTASTAPTASGVQIASDFVACRITNFPLLLNSPVENSKRCSGVVVIAVLAEYLYKLYGCCH